MTRVKSAYYFIVNPRAGSGKTMCEWIPAERKLDKLGVPYITAMTDHKKHATQLAYDAAEEGSKECSNTIALISHILLKILQARLQQYMNQELLDVQAGFRKGRISHRQM